MPDKRTITDFLNDILDAILKAEEFVEGLTFEDFLRDYKTVFATVHALEIIGEASSNIPESIRKTYSEIPWKKMVGMRNILIHQYFGLSKQVIWNTINNRFPDLKKQIRQMLKDETKKTKGK